MTDTASLLTLLGSGKRVEWHRPWPRVSVTEDTWNQIAQGLSQARWSLLGLWGDAYCVHMAVRDHRDIAVASLSCCSDGQFPSVGCWHPPAQRLERAIADLFGLLPTGSPDARPWLDHGCWPVCRPLLNATGQTAPPAVKPYAFLPVEGESLHQIPVGPVHAGIIEPGHFRFTANGETVVRLEARLGYVHKGIGKLMMDTSLAEAARLAGRVSGDSTVGYALAFARAVEAALGVEVPARVHWLRALLAELERIANHFGDIGAICNDAAFALMHAYCGVLREQVLRASAECFGHRLLMDCIAPGGVSSDLSAGGATALRRLVMHIRATFPALIELYDNTASLQDRTVETGIVSAELVRQFGCGGYIGRASGRAFDSRRTPGYPPYNQLEFQVPVLTEGDVNARVWIRIREVEQSLALIEQILDRLPPGSLQTESIDAYFGKTGEGIAMVEGFRGDILVWVRIATSGQVKRCHLRDPSWFQWPLLEAAIEKNIVADFPLCNKSFNCSYSGHDL